jgi:two-component system, chemotaxis family, protein-glutamate methylesterase/glutaminase
MKTENQPNAIYNIVLVGVSAGGFAAIPKLLSMLNADFPLPVVIVQHEAQNAGDYFSHYLGQHCRLPVKQADEKEAILPGTVYIAPPGYHLLVEEERTFSLSIDAPVNYARPSIDVLFETASDVYGATTIGIILTGANSDGAKGLKKIKDAGGLAIVQDPANAEVDFMPRAALAATSVDEVLPLDRIGPCLNALACGHPLVQLKEQTK